MRLSTLRKRCSRLTPEQRFSKRGTLARVAKGFRRVPRLLRFIATETLQTKELNQFLDEPQPLAATISDVFEMLRNLEKAKLKKRVAG